MREKLYTLGFVLALTAVFGAAVSGLQVVLKEKIEENKTVARQAVVLELFGLKPADEAWPTDKTVAEFAAKVATADAGAGYNYFHLQDPAASVFVFPIAGQGFWDRISGFAALDTATKLLRGVAFTDQLETPGLGARIEERWFREQFVGKSYDRLLSDGRRLRVVPSGTKRPDQAEVDAVTGATETSRSVERLLNQGIERFLQEKEKQAGKP